MKSGSVWRSLRVSVCPALLAGLLAMTGRAADDLRPVPADARVWLSFASGKSFVLGDVIEMTCTLSNAGINRFGYETGGDYRCTEFPPRYKVTVFDEDNLGLRPETWQEMGGLSGSRELAPGAKHTQTLRLQNYVQVSRAGTFTIRVAHDFGWKPSKERPLPVAEAKITIA